MHVENVHEIRYRQAPRLQQALGREHGRKAPSLPHPKLRTEKCAKNARVAERQPATLTRKRRRVILSPYPSPGKLRGETAISTRTRFLLGEMPMEATFFVAHQYTSDFATELRRGIENGLRGTGFRALYAEREYRAAHILDNVRSMILSSAFAIFDLSEANPNVFLELGVAVAARKAIYIICRKGTGDLPADVRGIQRLDYCDAETLAAGLQHHVAPYWRLGPDLTEEEVRRHCLRFYQVEDLYHRLGEEKEDPNASNGFCWAVLHSTLRGVEKWEKLTQHAVHGPYEGLPRQGLYKAYFRIKVDDNTRPDSLVSLDVYSGGNPKPANAKGERSIRGIDFDEAGAYQLFSVPFAYAGEDDLEFRVRPCGRGVTLFADYVAVVSATQEQQVLQGEDERIAGNEV